VRVGHPVGPFQQIGVRVGGSRLSVVHRAQHAHETIRIPFGVKDHRKPRTREQRRGRAVAGPDHTDVRQSCSGRRLSGALRIRELELEKDASRRIPNFDVGRGRVGGCVVDLIRDRYVRRIVEPGHVRDAIENEFPSAADVCRILLGVGIRRRRKPLEYVPIVLQNGEVAGWPARCVERDQLIA